jgi:hypothetical protein
MNRNPSQRTEPKGGAPVPVTVKDARAKSIPSAPVRHQATGRFRARAGGRRGR